METRALSGIESRIWFRCDDFPLLCWGRGFVVELPAGCGAAVAASGAKRLWHGTVTASCGPGDQVETDRISKYVLEIKDVPEFKDART